MIEILYERVAYHKDKFIAPILHDEMESMEVKKNGKVEHSDNSHDDQTFSYLMALRVWYDGIDVMERYGLQKNTIKTDEEVDIEMLSVEEAQNGENIDLQPITASLSSAEGSMDIDAELEQELQYVKDASRYMLGKDYERAMTDQENEMFSAEMQINKALRDEYNKKYHIDISEPAMGGGLSSNTGYTQLPDDLFGETEISDDEDMFNDNVRGNLAGVWRSIF